MKRLSLVVFLLLLLPLSCGDKVKPGLVETKRPVVSGVRLERVSLSDVESFYEASGTVAAKTVSVIGARTMGTVLSVKVKEGDRVGRGQELLVLDDRDLAQKVAAAEHGYREALKGLDAAEQGKRLANITYGRYKNLFDEKIISGQEMDQVETQKKVADLEYERAREATSRVGAQLEEVKINRGFTRVVAPHSGLIAGRKIDRGSLAAPGTPLIILEDTSQYRVEAPVDQRMAGLVRVGMPVVVSLPPDDRRIEGSIGEIVPAIEPATRSFLVKIDVKDPALRSGLYGRVFIAGEKKRTLLVPRRAIVEKGQLAGVYVVDDQGVMTYRIVRTGKGLGDRVEVLSGLRDGEAIAVAGLEKAIDGGLVRRQKEGL
jgi:RND family efflux transporter MFP subunit